MHTILIYHALRYQMYGIYWMTMPIVGQNSGNAGKGRPKGSLNRINASLKDMILGALNDAGGKNWLARQAQENPAAFMALLAKLLPLELKQELAQPEALTIRVIGGLPDD
jgi:hypothetical protein